MSELLRKRLIQEEGLRLFPYQDTVGIWTIGVGHNIEADPDMLPNLSLLMKTGITKEEALEILDRDIDKATGKLYELYPWTADLDEARREVLIDMCFNMGITRLFQFHNTMQMIENGQYHEAAENLRLSKWYRQVGKRAEHLIAILDTGEALA